MLQNCLSQPWHQSETSPLRLCLDALYWQEIQNSRKSKSHMTAKPHAWSTIRDISTFDWYAFELKNYAKFSHWRSSSFASRNEIKTIFKQWNIYLTSRSGFGCQCMISFRSNFKRWLQILMTLWPYYGNWLEFISQKKYCVLWINSRKFGLLIS